MEIIIVSMEMELHAQQECSPSNLSVLEVHLGYVLRQISNHVSDEFARALRAHRTSVAEWVVLRNLQNCEGVSPSDLAEALSFTRGAISKVLSKLAMKGWITRAVKAGDNRAQLVSLTRSGRRVLPQLIEIADRNDERQFSCLSDADQVAFRRILRKLADSHEIRDVPVD